jgi:hypothetical protein
MGHARDLVIRRRSNPIAHDGHRLDLDQEVGMEQRLDSTHVLAGGLTPEKNCATRAPTAGAIAGVYPTR